MAGLSKGVVGEYPTEYVRYPWGYAKYPEGYMHLASHYAFGDRMRLDPTELTPVVNRLKPPRASSLL
jgi:hypothetical protein